MRAILFFLNILCLFSCQVEKEIIFECGEHHNKDVQVNVIGKSVTSMRVEVLEPCCQRGRVLISHRFINVPFEHSKVDTIPKRGELLLKSDKIGVIYNGDWYSKNFCVTNVGDNTCSTDAKIRITLW